MEKWAISRHAGWGPTHATQVAQFMIGSLWRGDNFKNYWRCYVQYIQKFKTAKRKLQEALAKAAFQAQADEDDSSDSDDDAFVWNFDQNQNQPSTQEASLRLSYILLVQWRKV